MDAGKITKSLVIGTLFGAGAVILTAASAPVCSLSGRVNSLVNRYFPSIKGMMIPGIISATSAIAPLMIGAFLYDRIENNHAVLLTIVVATAVLTPKLSSLLTIYRVSYLQSTLYGLSFAAMAHAVSPIGFPSGSKRIISLWLGIMFFAIKPKTLLRTLSPLAMLGLSSLLTHPLSKIDAHPQIMKIFRAVIVGSATTLFTYKFSPLATHRVTLFAGSIGFGLLGGVILATSPRPGIVAVPYAVAMTAVVAWSAIVAYREIVGAATSSWKVAKLFVKRVQENPNRLLAEWKALTPAEQAASTLLRRKNLMAPTLLLGRALIAYVSSIGSLPASLYIGALPMAIYWGADREERANYSWEHFLAFGVVSLLNYTILAYPAFKIVQFIIRRAPHLWGVIPAAAVTGATTYLITKDKKNHQTRSGMLALSIITATTLITPKLSSFGPRRVSYLGAAAYGTLGASLATSMNNGNSVKSYQVALTTAFIALAVVTCGYGLKLGYTLARRVLPLGFTLARRVVPLTKSSISIGVVAGVGSTVASLSLRSEYDCRELLIRMAAIFVLTTAIAPSLSKSISSYRIGYLQAAAVTLIELSLVFSLHS
ncbi:MAG: hypothetical protein K1060chlam2_00963 [Chlamydiae bacterium]|nr:hypothetical protein [Chlamydiota bacterium]